MIFWIISWVLPQCAQYELCILFFLLCWPVLYPQMTGDPSFPGVLIVNESVIQSPMAEPIWRASPVALAVPSTWVAMEWVWKPKRITLSPAKIRGKNPQFIQKFTYWKSHIWHNSHFQNLIFHKIHIFKASLLTKFTTSNSHFYQNSQFIILIFFQIHIFIRQILGHFWIKNWFLP